MDLSFVDEVVLPRSRDDLPPPSPGTAFLAGGTWLYSQQQPDVTRVVDLTTLGWPALTVHDDALEIAATCTIDSLAHAEFPEHWTAVPLFRRCAESLVASWKIWRTATIGGNLALSLPAGAMTTAMCALGGELTVWTPDGGARTEAASTFVVGEGRNTLAPGEIVRSIRIGETALRGNVAVRKVAYTALGRSGALLVGRRGDDGVTLTVTAATVRPSVVHWQGVPTAAEVAAAIDAIPETDWLDDPHGEPAWRAHVTAVLAEEIRTELAGDAR
ncbi:FAD-binding molybdopterin dehydrogenase [Rhodococcus rhodnii]|uniref:FAD-binding PCMH-type domain-containing protein n=2 Tax=Rhodococcus rhodnii TaxID=38312 RepID=R7WJ09_9NOCA|nr:FAD binding domain-containing protein [Rhodococcus rhodnii]EOM75203.1 hypothetical protein Rrhod_3423 [Rhodococcus rhodnii LMG 5362]TXG89228.1 FAD-binding molybdopterin dehydrogenase [Rhodococcus rhodnii]